MGGGGSAFSTPVKRRVTPPAQPTVQQTADAHPPHVKSEIGAFGAQLYRLPSGAVLYPPRDRDAPRTIALDPTLTVRGRSCAPSKSQTVVVLILGLALAAVVMALLRINEQTSASDGFERFCTDKAFLIQKQLLSGRRKLEAFSSMLLTVAGADGKAADLDKAVADGFSSTLPVASDGSTAIMAMAWNPLVFDGDDRANFEAAFPLFGRSIFGRDSEGAARIAAGLQAGPEPPALDELYAYMNLSSTVSPVPYRNHTPPATDSANTTLCSHYVTTYLYPESPDPRVQQIGYDLASNSRLLAAVHQARDSATFTAVSVRYDDGLSYFLEFRPFYVNNTMARLTGAQATVAARRAAVRGVVMSQNSPELLLQFAVSGDTSAQLQGMVLDLRDNGIPNDNPTVERQRSLSLYYQTAATAIPAASSLMSSRMVEASVPTAGRTWALRCTPTHRLWNSLLTLYPWVVGGAICLVTLLIAFVMHRFTRHLAEVERFLREVQFARDVAQTATKAKSEFLAFLCHEVRNSLHAIIAMTSFILQSNMLGDEETRQLETIHESSELIRSIVNDALDISKMESGKITFERLVFEFRELLDSLMRVYRPSAVRKGIELRLVVEGAGDDGLPLYVNSDPARLRQAIGNLLANAIKFTHSGSVTLRVRTVDRVPSFGTRKFTPPPGGRDAPKDAAAATHSIEMKVLQSTTATTTTTVGATTGGVPATPASPASAQFSPAPAPSDGPGPVPESCYRRQVFEFAVIDTGVGIPGEALNTLFESYSQARLSIAREYGGTGLGLAIVKRVLDAMHGRIAVDTKLGRGTTFALTVPLETVDPAVAPALIAASGEWNANATTASLPGVPIAANPAVPPTSPAGAAGAGAAEPINISYANTYLQSPAPGRRDSGVTTPFQGQRFLADGGGYAVGDGRPVLPLPDLDSGVAVAGGSGAAGPDPLDDLDITNAAGVALSSGRAAPDHAGVVLHIVTPSQPQQPVPAASPDSRAGLSGSVNGRDGPHSAVSAQGAFNSVQAHGTLSVSSTVRASTALEPASATASASASGVGRPSTGGGHRRDHSASVFVASPPIPENQPLPAAAAAMSGGGAPIVSYPAASLPASGAVSPMELSLNTGCPLQRASGSAAAAPLPPAIRTTLPVPGAGAAAGKPASTRSVSSMRLDSGIPISPAPPAPLELDAGGAGNSQALTGALRSVASLNGSVAIAPLVTVPAPTSGTPVAPDSARGSGSHANPFHPGLAPGGAAHAYPASSGPSSLAASRTASPAMPTLTDLSPGGAGGPGMALPLAFRSHSGSGGSSRAVRANSAVGTGSLVTSLENSPAGATASAVSVAAHMPVPNSSPALGGASSVAVSAQPSPTTVPGMPSAEAAHVHVTGPHASASAAAVFAAIDVVPSPLLHTVVTPAPHRYGHHHHHNGSHPHSASGANSLAGSLTHTPLVPAVTAPHIPTLALSGVPDAHGPSTGGGSGRRRGSASYDAAAASGAHVPPDTVASVAAVSASAVAAALAANGASPAVSVVPVTPLKTPATVMAVTPMTGPFSGSAGGMAAFAMTPAQAAAASSPTAASAAAAVAVAGGGERPRILLAEDNLVNQKVVIRMLRDHARLDVVGDGAEALVKLAGNNASADPYRMVFMDINMPRMCGDVAAVQLRASGLTLPVVALTANAMHEDVTRYRAIGMNSVVTKPFNVQQLLQAMRDLIGYRPPAQQAAGAQRHLSGPVGAVAVPPGMKPATALSPSSSSNANANGGFGGKPSGGSGGSAAGL